MSGPRRGVPRVSSHAPQGAARAGDGRTGRVSHQSRRPQAAATLRRNLSVRVSGKLVARRSAASCPERISNDGIEGTTATNDRLDRLLPPVDLDAQGAGSGQPFGAGPTLSVDGVTEAVTQTIGSTLTLGS